MIDTLPAKVNAMQAVEAAVIAGDLSKLSEGERLVHYKRVCDSLGLNYYTKPFLYIVLNGKLMLYATRDATDQLRKINGISINIVSREFVGELYIVTARATDKTSRTDESIGAVSVGGSKGDVLANALMKCETKAKRRVTLSIAGLGWLDETEIETIPDAKPGPAVNLPAIAPTTEPTPAEVYAERTRLWQQWLAVKAEADRLGIETAPLGEHANMQQIRDAAKPVQAQIKAAKAERLAGTLDNLHPDQQ